MYRTHLPMRSVWLVQLPIPPLGPETIRGNVPLAAAYLTLWAENKGLGSFYDIQLLPTAAANTLGDRALVAALAKREPWLVGFTCYVWNIERTLWIARELKRLRPEVRIVLGGPEITADNSWVLATEAYDFAVIGEGEQTFTQLLLGLLEDESAPAVPTPGLYVPPSTGPRYRRLTRRGRCLRPQPATSAIRRRASKHTEVPETEGNNVDLSMAALLQFLTWCIPLFFLLMKHAVHHAGQIL